VREHRYIVPRSSTDELTFATVTAKTADYIRDEAQFLDKLEQAITNWMCVTALGRDAWTRSSADFNVGDLSEEVGERALIHQLAVVGIYDLEIDVHCHVERSRIWTYDRHLFDSAAVEEALETTS